jgi:ubiquinone/menaquinone biosynthesis C-methylase UbiE
MDRVLEPELMTEEENARAYAGADFSEAHQGYVSRFASLFPDTPAQAAALDLGCGPGDVTLRFGRRFSGWEIDAVDGSAAMLDQARLSLDREPDLRRRVHLFQAMLPDVTLAQACYQIVVSTSLLHHLPDPKVLWQTVRRFAAPGAIVFVADLFRPPTPDDAAALIDRYAIGEPDVLRLDFYNSLLAAFTPAEVERQLTDAGLTTLKVQTVSDRHLIVWGRMHD